MIERDVEAKIRDYAKACGGKAYKFVSPGNRGVPDRICVFPGAKILFVELKRPDLKDGRSASQKKVGAYLRKLGFTVLLINNQRDFVDALSEMGVRPV